MTLRGRVMAVLAGAAAGFCGGLFGVGGGVVLVPMLTGPLGLTQHQAHGTSLAVVVITAIAAVIVYAAHGNVAWSTGIILALASMASAPMGARLAARLSGRALARAFAAFLVVVAVRMLWKPPAVIEHGLSGPARIVTDLAIGGVAGVLAGFMGVGGGIIMVPALTLLLGMPQQLAQGTSLVAVIGAGLSGSIAHRRQGTLVIEPVPWLALGAALGGPLASWGVQDLPHEVLARAFAVFLLVGAVIIWSRAAKRR